jgi:protein arginine kinase activator
LTEISNGVRKEMHLCETCAIQQGIASKNQISINELLSGLLAVQPSDEELFGPSEQSVSCPNCGFTLEQFRKEAVLGCPYDYEVFEKLLQPLIAKTHDGKTIHCGKIPSRMPKDAKRQIELSVLRQQLQDAVKNEDYELAARLRDEISQLEKKP